MRSRTTSIRMRHLAVLASLLIAAVVLPSQRAAAFTTVIAQHSKSCLDVTGGSQATQDGALIEQWSCTTRSNQNWTLEDVGAGRFRIRAESSSKCIEPVESGTQISILQQRTCDGATGQLWFRQATTATPTTAGKGVYEFVHLVSGKCLSIDSSFTTDGAAATLADCSGGKNQQWEITPASTDPQLQTEIIVKHTGKCLDVTGGSGAIADGILIEQYPCSGKSNESFLLKDMGGNQVQIMPSNSMDLSDPKCVRATDDGLSVEQRSCSTVGSNHLWERQPGRLPGDYKFMNAATRTCMDVTGSDLSKPDLVKLATCNNTDHQNWSIGKRLTLELRAGEYWGIAQKFSKKSKYGGLYQIWGDAKRTPYSPVTDLFYVTGDWSELNPTETGSYNYAPIERPASANLSTGLYGLEELGKNNKKAILRVPVLKVVPQWLITKCKLPLLYNGRDKDGNLVPWGYPIWQSCPQPYLTQFIRGMFTQYKNDSRLAYAYITTLSSGEFWIPDSSSTESAWKQARDATPGADDAAKTATLRTQIQAFAIAVIDAWVDAVGPEKAVWTSASTWSNLGTVASDTVNKHALQEKGTQLREGIAESITANLGQSLIGQGLDDFDDTTPHTRPFDEQNSSYHQLYLTALPMEKMRTAAGTGAGSAIPLTFYGDEFEKAADVYDDPDTAAHETSTYAGVFDNYDYYRMAVLNMLRKGENYAIFPEELRTTDNDAAHPQFAMLRDYFRQTAGYPETEAPDGWAVLQVWYDGSHTQHRVHNYEKYVTQREVPGGGLTRAEAAGEGNEWPPGMFAFDYSNGVKPTAYFSKSTDRASQNNYIYFKVDDDFASNTGSQYRIAVYYRDEGYATWSVQYTDTHSTQFTTETVTNTNDGHWKTAVFNVPKIGFVGAIGSGMDFRIYNGGSTDMTKNMDVTIGSVRVIRY